MHPHSFLTSQTVHLDCSEIDFAHAHVNENFVRLVSWVRFPGAHTLRNAAWEHGLALVINFVFEMIGNFAELHLLIEFLVNLQLAQKLVNKN